MMIKAVRIALVSSTLLCGSAGVVLAQWYPPGLDEHASYKIPGTNEFFTGRGEVLINSYPDVQHNKVKAAKPATAPNVSHPAVGQRNAPLGG
jgi:hypothetical protein